MDALAARTLQSRLLQATSSGDGGEAVADLTTFATLMGDIAPHLKGMAVWVAT